MTENEEHLKLHNVSMNVVAYTKGGATALRVPKLEEGIYVKSGNKVTMSHAYT